MELVELDPDFAVRWVQWRYQKRFSTPEPEDFKVPDIWERPDAAVLMDAAFTIASKARKVFVGCDDYLSFFFTPAPDQDLSATVIAAQDDWLRHRIEKGYKNEGSCQVLLGIVHTLPEERRIDLLVHFIDQKPDLKVFRRTALDARLARVVVRVNGAREPRIPFLQQLLGHCTGRSRLTYRAVVEEAIEYAQSELKAAQQQAIIEERA